MPGREGHAVVRADAVPPFSCPSEGPIGRRPAHFERVLQSRRVTSEFSKTQIDKLGERLKAGGATETDLRELDRYRRSFGTAYDRVTHLIREHLSLEPTGRPAKSTQSIVEKLRRESIRLTQIQDIAGCRIVVTDRGTQDE